MRDFTDTDLVTQRVTEIETTPHELLAAIAGDPQLALEVARKIQVMGWDDHSFRDRVADAVEEAARTYVDNEAVFFAQYDRDADLFHANHA